MDDHVSVEIRDHADHGTYGETLLIRVDGEVVDERTIDLAKDPLEQADFLIPVIASHVSDSQGG